MVLCLFSIDDSWVGSLRSTQRVQLSRLGLTSITPGHLPRAAETFRATLPRQDAEFPVDHMTGLPAWRTLQDTLSAYQERLQLLGSQDEELGRHLEKRSSWTSSAALVAIVVFGILSWLGQRIAYTNSHPA